VGRRAAWTAVDQHPPSGADGGYDRVHRHRRVHPAFVIDCAGDGGIGRYLDGGAEEAGTEEPPADSGPVEDEVSGKAAGVQIRVHR
jgi:hypothetical protein